MTFSQAHYRLVFQEGGVNDASVARCIEDAKLIVSLKIDSIIEELQPPKIEFYFEPAFERDFRNEWLLNRGMWMDFPVGRPWAAHL